MGAKNSSHLSISENTNVVIGIYHSHVEIANQDLSIPGGEGVQSRREKSQQNRIKNSHKISRVPKRSWTLPRGSQVQRGFYAPCSALLALPASPVLHDPHVFSS